MSKASTPKRTHPWRAHNENTVAARKKRGEQHYVEQPALMPIHSRVGRPGRVGRIR